MSNHSAIAAVTATLTNMIQTAVSAETAVAGGKVTARPPDRARQDATGNQINLFLYRTSIDAAWRNQDSPGIRPGESGQPPLPLVLSYLITGYGENDDEVIGHRLLGLAMGVLNDKPLLAPADIANSLAPGPGSGLENQVQRVRITPDPRPQDEISRMWATFGTGYRLSVSYDAAVVLIDSTRPTRAPIPVLARGSGDRGPAVNGSLSPTIELVQPSGGLPSARPGDTVTVTGRHLGAVSALRVSGIRLTEPVTLAPATRTATALEFALPVDPPLPAGTVSVAALYQAAPGLPVPGNAAPLALAPAIESFSPRAPKLNQAGATTLTVTCSPPVTPGQTIALVVGDRLVTLPPVTTAATKLTFALTGLAAGTATLRLRIDSVDSSPVAPPVTAPGSAPGTAANPDAPAPLTIDPGQQVTFS